MKMSIQASETMTFSQTSERNSNIDCCPLRRGVQVLLSLAEQQRIVAILDRFDTLVHDLPNGLPAEITAIRKQYEYYRDKLLTFQKARV